MRTSSVSKFLKNAVLRLERTLTTFFQMISNNLMAASRPSIVKCTTLQYPAAAGILNPKLFKVSKEKRNGRSSLRRTVCFDLQTCSQNHLATMGNHKFRASPRSRTPVQVLDQGWPPSLKCRDKQNSHKWGHLFTMKEIQLPSIQSSPMIINSWTDLLIRAWDARLASSSLKINQSKWSSMHNKKMMKRKGKS